LGFVGSNLGFLENLARNATLAIAFYRHHELSMGPLLRYRIVSSAMDALEQALPDVKPTHGWHTKGEALTDKVPHGHWKTLTFIAGLRHDGIVAPCVIDGPVNG